MKITRASELTSKAVTRELPITSNQLTVWEANKLTHPYDTHMEFLQLIMPDLDNEQRYFFETGDNSYNKLYNKLENEA